MQWLIDLIVEKLGIPPVYVDRGRAHPPDFVVENLTLDGEWHTLDFSNVCPEGTSALNIQIKAKSDALGKVIRFRKDSISGTLNTCVARFAVVDIDTNFSFIMGVTAARTMDYSITAGTYALFGIRTRGWFL